MRPCPEPEKPVKSIHSKSAIVQANAHGAEPTDAFEAKGWMGKRPPLQQKRWCN